MKTIRLLIFLAIVFVSVASRTAAFFQPGYCRQPNGCPRPGRSDFSQDRKGGPNGGSSPAVIPRNRKLYLALLAPTPLVLLVFIVAPITQSIIFSFHRIIIGLPHLKSPFIGHIMKACDVGSLHWK